MRGTIILNSHGYEIKKLEDADLSFWADITTVLIDGLSYVYDSQLSGDNLIVFSHDPAEKVLYLKSVDELDSYRF